MSIIAALAMLMAMVGCDLEYSYKVQEETIYEGHGSVYPITKAEMKSGEEFIEFSFNNNMVKLKSNPDEKTGNGSMVLESEEFCKKANVNLSVLGSGAISGIYDLKNYQYSRSNSTYSESIWKDVSGTTNPLGLATGWYKNSGNNEENIAAEGALSYIYVDGKIVYYVYYLANENYSEFREYNFDVTFVRTIMTGTSGNITLKYDSKGLVTISDGKAKFFNEEKYLPNDAAKYGIVDDGTPNWQGADWHMDGSSLTNGAAVYLPYSSGLPDSYKLY